MTFLSMTIGQTLGRFKTDCNLTSLEVPSVLHIYDGDCYLLFRCEGQFITIYPADVVLFEGILVFYFPEIRDLFHMKLFVDTDSDTRLARRGE